VEPYVERAVFRLEGEVYTLAFEGKTIQMKERDGLRYVHDLLANPGHAIPAEDLHRRLGSRTADGSQRSLLPFADIEAAGLRVASPASQLESPDRQALDTYRARLRAIVEEKQAALDSDDERRLDELDQEEDGLVTELRRWQALGGRSRAVTDPMKKPRQAVHQAIKLTRRLVEQRHERLGHFLKNHIRTGNFCSFEPDPTVDWVL